MLDFETSTCSLSRINCVKLRQLKAGFFCLFSRIKFKTSGLSLWTIPTDPPDWTFTNINIIPIYGFVKLDWTKTGNVKLQPGVDPGLEYWRGFGYQQVIQ